MPFVKLDCGILNSTLWIERECRELFITALLMAEPRELPPMPQIAVRTLDETGWIVPPGWYGFVEAAGSGIIRRAIIDDEVGICALEKLCAPDHQSRSQEYEVRRMARIDGGYVILNYMKYRDRDYTAAARQRKYREKLALRRNMQSLRRNITQAEAYAYKEKDNISPSPARLTVAFTESGFEVPEKQKIAWQKAYPLADIGQCISMAYAWCLANPEKRPRSRFGRFLNSWIRTANGDAAAKASALTTSKAGPIACKSCGSTNWGSINAAKDKCNLCPP